MERVIVGFAGQADKVDAAELDAADGGKSVGEFFDLGGFTPEDDGLQVVVMVEVDVGGGQDIVSVISIFGSYTTWEDGYFRVQLQIAGTIKKAGIALFK